MVLLLFLKLSEHGDPVVNLLELLRFFRRNAKLLHRQQRQGGWLVTLMGETKTVPKGNMIKKEWLSKVLDRLGLGLSHFQCEGLAFRSWDLCAKGSSSKSQI